MKRHHPEVRRHCIVTLLAVLSLVQFFSPAYAQVNDTTFIPHFKPSLEVPRIASPIEIDGAMTDAAWQSAGHSDYFQEVNPGDQIRPAVKSEFRICYDDHNLYVALVAHDVPDAVRVHWRDRDNIFSDDYIGILLDCYGDNNSAYEIFVNPYGLQGDLRITNSNGDEDISYNLIFDSRGTVTDSGYQVELAIPFSSLRFPDKEEQTWRCQVWRDRQRDARYRYAWSAQDRNDPCFLCNWGTLTGIRGIKPSTNLEILPNLIATQSGARLNDSMPGSRFDSKNLNADASVTLKYGVTSSSTLEATINPDFSQVESDAGQIDVNSTFALSFSEARPFFAEGADLYNTWISSIYTRSINDPDVAAKFVGRPGETSIAYTFARDRHSPILVPSAEESDFFAGGKSWSNILRVRHALPGGSYLGMLMTDRRLDDGGSGSDAGVDGTIRFWGNNAIEFQTVISRTEEPHDTALSSGINGKTFDYGRHTTSFDGEKYWGHASFLNLERNTRHYGVELRYLDFSPTFRSDNGFVVQNDYRQISTEANLEYQPNKSWLRSWVPWMEIAHVWRYNDPIKRFRDGWAVIGVNAELAGQTDVEINYLNSHEVFRSRTFEGISRVTFVLENRYIEWVAFGGNTTFGRSIARNLDVPVMGRQFNLYFYLNIRPTKRFYVAPSISFAQMRHERKYLDAHPGTDPEIFKGYILRTRLTYQFTREWYLRTVIQYDQFKDRLDIEPFISYQLNPFTIFYAGINSRYKYYDRVDSDTELSDSQWELSSRQVFVKLQYLWRL